MSDKPLTIDEPGATGWLRSEYYGDTEKAKGYAHAARKVLGGMRSMYGVNDRIANGEPGGYYKQAVDLPDGTRIEAYTNDGHDKLRIFAASSAQSSDEQFTPEFPSTSFQGEKTAFEGIPEKTAFEGVPTASAFTPEFPTEVRPERKFREFCVWGPDREVYTASIPVAAISMPVMDSNGVQIYAGVTLLPDYPHEVRIFDGDTMEQAGAIVIDLDWATGNSQLRRTLAVDTDSDTFIWITKGQSGGDGLSAHGFTWQAGAASAQKIVLMDGLDVHLLSETAVAGRLVIGGNRCTGPGTFVYASHVIDFATMVLLHDASIADPALASLGSSFYLPTASVMPNSDVIFQYPAGTVFPDFAVVKNEESRLIYEPAGMPGFMQADPRNNTYTMVGTNDGQLWVLALTDAYFPSQASGWSLSRSTAQGWELVEVDDGIVFDASGYPALLHDPVSDAVALVQSDASGIWIFNAHDCLYDPIPDFFHPIEAPPAAFAHGHAGYAGQFYDGSLLLLFGSLGDFVIGRYDIGLLKQTKLEEEDFS